MQSSPQFGIRFHLDSWGTKQGQRIHPVPVVVFWWEINGIHMTSTGEEPNRIQLGKCIPQLGSQAAAGTACDFEPSTLSIEVPLVLKDFAGR